MTKQTDQWIEIGPATHPRDGEAGTLQRHAKTGVYGLRLPTGGRRSFPARDGLRIEHQTAGVEPGRPPQYGVAMLPVTVRMPPDMEGWVQSKGGAEYVRGLIQRDMEQHNGTR